MTPIQILCWAIVLLFILVPLFYPYECLKLFVFILRHTCYVVRLEGEDNIPKKGGALLVSNHVSMFDSLILVALTNRKIRFMMHTEFYRMKLLHFLFRRIGVIEVPTAGQTKKMAFFLDRVKQLLRDGNLVVIFPEGGVSGNGLILRFKKGISRMLPDDVEVPVIPIRLGMLWGSMFSFYSGRLRWICPRQFPMPVAVSVGKPLSPHLTPYQLRQKISEMGADAEKDPFFPGERPLHHMFARRTNCHPFQVVFKDQDAEGIRNFELLVRSLVISKMIRKLDDYNSTYIGVLLPNCTTMVSVLFGIMYADRIPAVLNFTAGDAARKCAIDKAKIKIILTSRKFLQKLKIEPTEEMILLEDLAPQIPKEYKRTVIRDVILLTTTGLMRKYSPVSMSDLTRQAVLLFSSGSTGIPKGIMLSHHNLCSNFFNFWRIINWTPRDRVVGNLPMFHAYGFMIGFALPAMVGTRVIFLPNPLDSAGVCSVVEKEKVTLMMATPTFLQNYMRKYKPHQFDSLRLAITGAEKLRHDISNKFRELTGLEIVEGFGCTELSPIVAINLSYSVFTLGRESGKPGSVGAPLPGIHVKIVDPATFEELPENTPGLMLVKGGLVMLGYLDDPEGTGKVIQDGFYNTGDIASMSADGYLTITGRLARFSKIAGEMVPHELIEMAINEELQSEDRCVGVCGAKDSRRGERILVFYSTDQLVPADMVARLQAREMPNLWIPKATDFVRLDAIPLLGAGKIDLQKLRDLAAELPES